MARRLATTLATLLTDLRLAELRLDRLAAAGLTGRRAPRRLATALASLATDLRLDKLAEAGLTGRRVLRRSATALASLLKEVRLDRLAAIGLLVRLELTRRATALAIASTSTLRGILSLLFDVDRFGVRLKTRLHVLLYLNFFEKSRVISPLSCQRISVSLFWGDDIILSLIRL